MGDDWKGKFDFLKEEGCEVVYLPRTPEISSSRLKKISIQKKVKTIDKLAGIKPGQFF